jgi:hypothetical protein
MDCKNVCDICPDMGVNHNGAVGHFAAEYGITIYWLKLDFFLRKFKCLSQVRYNSCATWKNMIAIPSYKMQVKLKCFSLLPTYAGKHAMLI